MKKILTLSMIAAAALLSAACTKEMSFNSDVPSFNAPEVTFSVSTEGAKTALQSDYSVIFNVGDSIRVQGKAAHSFKTEAAGGCVDFTGTLADDDTTTFCAFYPYGAYSSSQGDGVYNVRIPNVQTGVKGGFDPTAQVMVARSSGTEFKMYNVCALVKLTLTTADITSVTLANAAGAKIAGTVSVTIPASGAPAIGEANLENIVLFPEGDAFEAGDYYIAVAPAALTGGLQLTFTRTADDAIATKIGASATTFYRSELLKLGAVDAALTWTPIYKAKVSFWEDELFHNPFNFAKFSTAASSPHYPDKYVVLRDTASNLGVPFHSTGGFVGGGYGIRILGDESSYFKFPVLNGLTPVGFRAAAGAEKTYFSLQIAAGNELARGGNNYNVAPSKGTKYTWFFVNPDASTEYRVCKTGSGELRMLSWEFLYTGTLEPTVSVVSLLDNTGVSATGVTFNGKYYTYNKAAVANVTCGFEYKTDGEWTSVQCAEASSDFSYTVTGLTSGVTYTYRAWTADAYHKVYSEEQTFVPVAEVTYTLNLNTASFDVEPAGVTGSNNAALENKLNPLPEFGGNHNTIYVYPIHRSDRTGASSFALTESYLKFYYTSVANTYVLLPALNGLTLTKVSVITVTGSTSSGKWGVLDGDTAVTGGAYAGYGSSFPKTNTFNLSGTAEGKAYRLASGYNKNAVCISTITLTYTGTETATAQFVYAPTFSEGTVSAKMLFNTVTVNADITCGFEYKAGGAGEFTTLAAGIPGTLAEGVSMATASATLAAGDIVRAWASIDGGTTKIYSPEKTISE